MENQRTEHHSGAEGHAFPEGMRAQLAKTEDFDVIANVFHQLGDPKRVCIFWILCHCEECVVNLSEMMNMSSPAVSHHLRSLRTSGLLISRREGKEVYYRAADTPQSQLLHQMIEMVMQIACPEEGTDRAEEES